ncbi:hypothetical protein Heshes_01580 [Alicyclobacillus hesperidum]|uniref:Uncharacterized protein n=1 Tax=Alicyclobacillus hesperidum TaxID=89784 RepID=A0A1H2SNM8_9BACL|nr:hypothetical protein [Alicyclobacillus hesperidum]GLV12466.1 hypothetical protein Heshes_01500 [Alicyclobacillus hesperidum]GLV12474.1 hypothetical protein Heshes_01580 [Alicyclobacillus hesperidum]SDW33212.1 hypothetical protein SAMN04489725_104160 [Alicyclobacillus hesperidum]
MRKDLHRLQVIVHGSGHGKSLTDVLWELSGVISDVASKADVAYGQTRISTCKTMADETVGDQS